MSVRSIDLVDSQIGTKFIMLSRNQSLSIKTYDHPFNPETNLMIPDYYSTKSVNGKLQYDYHFTAPEILKSSPDNILLADFSTKRGDKVIVYLDNTANDRNRVTIFNPQKSVNAILRPDGLLEVIFINPQDPMSLPNFNEGNASFGMELIRREIICDRDPVFRPNNNIFDIRRWVTNSCQVHMFFRIYPRDLQSLSKSSVEGHLFGPIINFFNNGKNIEYDSKGGYASISIFPRIYLNKENKENLKLIKTESHIKVFNEAIGYGTEPGMCNGSLILSENTKEICVDRQTGYQDVEICLPFEKVHFQMVYNPPHGLSGRVQYNGYRVVNDKYFHKYIVSSDLPRFQTFDNHWSGIGKAQFKQDEKIYEFPVIVGNYRVDRPKTHKEIIELPTIIKKVRVAKVKLQLISNGNNLFESNTTRINSSYDRPTLGCSRYIENPADGETLCLFRGESLNIRLKYEEFPWKLSSFPLTLYESGSKFNKEKKTDEFRFCISCYFDKNKTPLPIVFESGKIFKKIYVQILD